MKRSIGAVVLAVWLSVGVIGSACTDEAATPDSETTTAEATSTPTPDPQANSSLDPLTSDEVAQRPQFGRLRVVAPGGPVEWDEGFVPSGPTGGLRLGRSELATKGLVVPSLTPPPGFAIAEEQFEVSESTTGRTTLIQGGMTLANSGGTTRIVVTLHALKPSAVLDVVAGPARTWHYSGHPEADVIIRSMSPGGSFEPVNVAHVVLDDMYLQIDAPGLDVDQLVALVDSVRLT